MLYKLITHANALRNDISPLYKLSQNYRHISQGMFVYNRLVFLFIKIHYVTQCYMMLHIYTCSSKYENKTLP